MALSTFLVRRALLGGREISSLQQVAEYSVGIMPPEVRKAFIGKREVVGYGMNGEPSYFDNIGVPLPAIRFKEVTPEIEALRVKEKEDWKKLSVAEKKELYRASFCQTFAEINAPTGKWKFMISALLLAASTAMWMYLGLKIFIYPPMPRTLGEEYQKAQLQRMIDLRVNPISGIGSKYDYEKNEWKKEN